VKWRDCDATAKGDVGGGEAREAATGRLRSRFPWVAMRSFGCELHRSHHLEKTPFRQCHTIETIVEIAVIKGASCWAAFAKP
jgi:hypothetical protein